MLEAKDTGADVLQKKEKKSTKSFFWRFPTENNKTRSLQIFGVVCGVFQQTFNVSQNSAVLEPRTGQILRT